MNQYTINIRNCVFVIMTMVGLSITGCKKFADVPAPSNQLSSATVFTNKTTLASALAGMYSTMITTNSDYMQAGLTSFPGMSADEMLYSASYASYEAFMNNAIPVSDLELQLFWSAFYKNNYVANSIIIGTQNSADGAIPDSIKTDAIAESKFVRAYNHFYLVNFWGEVPIVTTTDPTITNTLYRSSKQDVYLQIINDLKDAKSGLKGDYSWSSGDRSRPNKYAAIALLARASLYTGDWAAAAANADTVIKATSLYSLLSTTGMTNIFAKNNTEAIWQMAPAQSAGYTTEAVRFIPVTGSVPSFILDSTRLIKAFETGDKRYINWVGKQVVNSVTYYYPYKYKLKATSTTSAECITYLRLAEQYLVRAEANAQLNNLSAAIADINVIRNRAGLPNTTATTQADILKAIEQERRVELCFEYGHRWMDLKRNNRADAVLGTKTGWVSTDALYPVPQADRNNNHNLSQNEGY